MAYFKITYNVSRDEVEEYVELNSYDEAVAAAYEAAIEYYDSFAGLHGIPSVQEVAYDMFIDRFEHECDEGEEDYFDDYFDADELWEKLTEEERNAAYEEYAQERESWIGYEAIEVSKEEYENGGELDDEEDD